MGAKVWAAVIAEALVFAALLFGAAGTTRWPGAWAFLALFLVTTLFITIRLARRDPALLDERMRSLVQEDQPVWDRVLMVVLFPLFLGWLILMGLDAARFRWSSMPAWLQGIGAVGFVLAMAIIDRTFRENTFLAPVVKIQAERGQRVISTGPYAVVRHPMYAGALIFFPSVALLLGSWWGLAATLLLVALLVVRTALEDRELGRRLDGYRDYAHRVRYRLIPRIW